MTKKQAFAEATRRWFIPNPAGGQALRVAIAFLGHRNNPMRYRVGHSTPSGQYVECGASNKSWEEAFLDADQRAGSP
jgi:hypothetical protein